MPNPDRHPALKTDPQEILAFLQMISPKECVSEIRLLGVVNREYKKPHTIAGYFDHNHLSEAASQIARIQDGHESSARGVYVTLNPVAPSLHARAHNRLKTAETGTLTKDNEIESVRTLLLDLDPRRPAGISSSDSEHQLAHQLAVSVKQALEERGFPLPVTLNSGNGWHLLYRLDLQNTVEDRIVIQQLLRAISARFSNRDVLIDSQVFNPARITKVAGTVVCKGDCIPERPWRRAHLEVVPNPWEIVPRETLERCLDDLSTWDKFTTATAPKQRRHFDDFLAAAAQNGYRVTEPRESNGRSIRKMQCPWRPDDGESVYISETVFGVFAACWHKTCPGSRERGNHWQELQRMIHGNEVPHDMPIELESSENRMATERRITRVSELPLVWNLSANLRWMVEGLIAFGSVTLLCSDSGVGKTWLAYHIAGCVAHGKPFLGRLVKKCRVLYIDGENPLFVVKQRIHDLGVAPTSDLMVWGGWNDSPPPGPDSTAVVDFAKGGDCLIVYDSMVEFQTGSEQSATDTRTFMRYLRRLANLGAAVVVLHHTGKAESSRLYRGSSDIKASVDMAYLLERTSEEDGKLGELNLKCFKGRLAPGPKVAMRFARGQGFDACDPGPKDGPMSLVDVIYQVLVAASQRNQTQVVKAAQALGFAKHQIEVCLKTGPWHHETGLHGAILYSVREELAEIVL